MALSGTVHVIDDDLAMRESVEFLLSSAGYDVELYETAQAFLDLSEPTFGCILSDVRMPGIDGLDLLKRLKSSGSKLPVLIMTGHGDVPLAVEAMK
ncbi:response regulator, partial [Rhodopseudomonas sp. B29]|uniref:response regulator n=1 Tax=Rhodopseudomonas sp. B29 TaxID=95607 RepID=UPI0003B51E20